MAAQDLVPEEQLNGASSSVRVWDNQPGLTFESVCLLGTRTSAARLDEQARAAAAAAVAATIVPSVLPVY